MTILLAPSQALLLFIDPANLPEQANCLATTPLTFRMDTGPPLRFPPLADAESCGPAQPSSIKNTTDARAPDAYTSSCAPDSPSPPRPPSSSSLTSSSPSYPITSTPSLSQLAAPFPRPSSPSAPPPPSAVATQLPP